MDETSSHDGKYNMQTQRSDIIGGAITELNMSIRSLAADIKGQAATVTELKSSIKILESGVLFLTKIISEPSDRSLIVRVALAENDIAAMHRTLAEFEDKYKVDASDAVRVRWQMRAAVASGIIGFIGSLIILSINIIANR